MSIFSWGFVCMLILDEFSGLEYKTICLASCNMLKLFGLFGSSCTKFNHANLLVSQLIYDLLLLIGASVVLSWVIGVASVAVPRSNCYALDNSSHIVDFVSFFFWYYKFGLHFLMYITGLSIHWYAVQIWDASMGFVNFL